ncbi:hypothetical protein ACFQE0_20645 [Methylobacterium komagatae]|uniref:Uncharacterized protein n=1 Tax=Methylobacterium komagatae TaxID=374425 RepID=A0ABW2BQE5_9HYPH
MTGERLLLYASSNGDQWWLRRGHDHCDVFVWHEPNVSSGGHTSRIELGRFLSDVPQGPQHQELMRLLGSLIVANSASPQIGGPQPEAGAAGAEPTPGESAS